MSDIDTKFKAGKPVLDLSTKTSGEGEPCKKW